MKIVANLKKDWWYHFDIGICLNTIGKAWKTTDGEAVFD